MKQYSVAWYIEFYVYCNFTEILNLHRVICVSTMKCGEKYTHCALDSQTTIYVSSMTYNRDVNLLPSREEKPVSLIHGYWSFRLIYFSFAPLLVQFSSVACLYLPGLNIFLSLPPVHCKQPRGKCSLSQPGPSVNSPHSRYLILLVCTLF